MEEQPVWLALCSADQTLMRATAACLQACDPQIHSVVFRRGQTLLQEMRRAPRRYQYVLLDDIMRDMDVLEFMLQLQEMNLEKPPYVLYAATPDAFYRILQLLPGDGSRFIFLPGPLRPELLAERMRTFCSKDILQQQADQVRLFLQKMHLTGKEAQYLSVALPLRMKSSEELALRKGLLQATADHYGVSLAAVDSALRRGIKTMEEENRPEYRQFKRRYGLPADKRPTVAAFLDASAACLKDGIKL